MDSQVKLKRSVSLTLLTLYGLGTIVGAGIYVLIGEVVNRAGTYAPLSFFIAASVASLTALVFAELSSRYPRSAGEAAYVQAGFAIRWLSIAVGWGVVTVGVVSSATIIRGFVGYLLWFIYVPEWLVITSLVLALTAVAIWGITQSLRIAAIATLLEIGGLLLVIGVNLDAFTALPDRWQEVTMVPDQAAWLGVTLGAFLAFFAFIGFEDMVNIAEEVENARRTLPRAIILALVISVTLYVLVAIVSVLALPVAELGASTAPLSDLVEGNSMVAARVVGAISLVAIINGALIQIIMASRVLYGMSGQGLAPRILSSVSPLTRTPVLATLLVAALIMILALGVPLVRLAEVTSFITLLIFATMHLTLLRLKATDPRPVGTISYPRWVPMGGIVATTGLLAVQVQRLLF